MLLLPVWDWLVGEVFNLPGVTSGPKPCFNPYLGVNPAIDRPGADCLRRENLRRYLESFAAWPETLVIGEAPGWRGCRFSGVPFTSEAQLDGRLPFCGAPSSLAKWPHSEATATIFWQVMREYHPRFLVWNSLPLHPYLPGEPLSNRRPTEDELGAVGTTLMKLIKVLEPRRVIAVGRSAQATLKNLEMAVIAVRHPSYGGAKAFQAGMRSAFSDRSFQ